MSSFEISIRFSATSGIPAVRTRLQHEHWGLNKTHHMEQEAFYRSGVDAIWDLD
jgi:hypothetical protein